MSEEKLIDHVVSRLEPQILYYVERQENWRENRNERYANNSRPQREFNRFENQGFANNRRFEGRRQGGQSDQRFHNQGSRQSGSRNSTFRGQNERNRHLNFFSDRCAYGGNRSRGTGKSSSFGSSAYQSILYKNDPSRITVCPYTIKRNLYYSTMGHGSGEIFYFGGGLLQIFFILTSSKDETRVVTAQGAPCSRLGRVELQIRIREFQKPWEFHILNNMQYQCILGIDFMKASRLTLDFDQQFLTIRSNNCRKWKHRLILISQTQNLVTGNRDN
ncbi:uncharacterized protein TNCV_4943741 [Trichonephila clavipes]|nr:uncharacterized protein TNCV_4943741 [Trichonephila clavipes]